MSPLPLKYPPHIMLPSLGLRCSYLFYYSKMSAQISLTISRILNWSAAAESSKLEIGFYSTTGAYLAHKTLNAHYYQQTLIINTSFKIHYLPEHQVVMARVTAVEERAHNLIGQIEVNLAQLKEKQLLYIPFREFQNVLEVKLYTPKSSPSPQLEKASGVTRQHFLQERNEFIDKLNDHEAELKKRFSEKVYNLLKDIKNRGSPQSKQRAKSSKIKNELEFRSRLSPQKMKAELKKKEGTRVELRGGSPGKPKPQHELLLDSMENKAGNKVVEPEQQFKSQKKPQYGKNHKLSQQSKSPFGLMEQDSRR